MSELLRVIIMVAFAALCFGGDYLTAFIVTSNQWRGDMIKRGFCPGRSTNWKRACREGQRRSHDLIELDGEDLRRRGIQCSRATDGSGTFPSNNRAIAKLRGGALR